MTYDIQGPEICKVTSKGQLTLPKDVRDELGLERGSIVAFFVDREKDVALLRRVASPNQKEAFVELHKWGKTHVQGKPRMSLSDVTKEIHRIRGE